MKSTVKFWLAPALVLLGLLKAVASENVVSDPLLGMEYDPAKVRFGEVGQAQREAMRVREGRWWVFAEFEDAEGGGRYLVIGGLAPHYLDTEPPTPGPLEYAEGLVVLCRKEGCESLGTVDIVTERKPKLAPRIVRGVVDDYVARLTKALGSREEVEKVIRAQKLRPWTTPPVAEALVRAGIDAPTWWGEDPGRADAGAKGSEK